MPTITVSLPFGLVVAGLLAFTTTLAIGLTYIVITGPCSITQL